MPDTATFDFQPVQDEAPPAFDFQPVASAEPPMPSVRDVMKMSAPWSTRQNASAAIDQAGRLPVAPTLPPAQNRLSIGAPRQGTATQEVERQGGAPLTLAPTRKTSPVSFAPADETQEAADRAAAQTEGVRRLVPPPENQNQITPVPRPALGQPTLPAPQSTEPKQNVTLVSTGFGTGTWIANDNSMEARQQAANLNAAQGEAVRGVTGVAGYPRIASGLKTLVPTSTQPYPSGREAMAAGAEVLGGAGQAATPAMIAGAPLVNTPALIGMVGGGAAADIGAKAIADKVHASPEAKALIGEAATLVGGFAGGMAGGMLYGAAKDFSPIEDSLATLLWKRGFVDTSKGQVTIGSEAEARAAAQAILKKNPVSLGDAVKIWRESRSQQASERIPTGDVEYVGPKMPRTQLRLTGPEPTREEIANAMDTTNFAGPDAYRAEVAAQRQAQVAPATLIPSSRAGAEGAAASPKAVGPAGAPSESSPATIATNVAPPQNGNRAIQPPVVAPPAAQPAPEKVAFDFQPETPAVPFPARATPTQHGFDHTITTGVDVGEKVRGEQPPLPRGERRDRVRTPEELETTKLFTQARKELGEAATNEQIDQRISELRKQGETVTQPNEPAKPAALSPVRAAAAPAAGTVEGNAPAPPAGNGAGGGEKFKYRSTQANIPADSEAHTALEAARERISDTDLAGKGKDVGGNHLTVKQGLKAADDDKLTELKQYLASLSPFEATLGKTEKFAPTEHSDGAAVIQAPIEAKELHQINKDLEQHGDFQKSDFGEYKPHATVAYVKPEVAHRYVGMPVTAGKKFKVSEIAITDRDGKQELVKLEGKGGPKFTVKKADIVPTPEGSYEARPHEELDFQAEGAPEKSRVASLIDRFEQAMKDQRLPTGSRELRDLAKETVGGNPAEYVDDIYDALEGASNRMRRDSHGGTLQEQITRAQAAESQLAKRTRTLDITKLQQFSTPHTISTAAAYAVDVRKGETVGEPTAGTGNLVEPLRDKGVTIKTVELDPRRAEVLKANGYDPQTADYLRTPMKADAFVMNPPWGKASTGRYKALDVPAPWGRFGDISERFFLKAFKELPEGGRISAVMPTTILGPASNGFRKWIAENGTLRAMVQSPPGAYEHRGTTVESVLLVADKGKIKDAPAAITRVESNQPKDWAEYAKAIEPLANGGSHARNAHQPGLATSPGEEPAALGDRTPARPESADAGAANGRGLSGVRERGAGVEPVRREPAGMAPEVVPAGNVHEPLDGPGADGEAQPAAAPRLVRQGAGILRPGEMAAARRAEFEEASRSPVFTPYVLRSAIAGNPHPRQVVETRSLAGAPAPEITYQPSKGVLDAHKRGVISDEQVDVVNIARQANENGHAVMVADDVGVGKSREIAAIAIDILEKGKGKRGLITSKGEVNLRDLEREMKIVAGVDPDSGTLPFRYVYLRDFKDAAERGNKKTPYQPVPAYDNAVYVVESTNLTPYGHAISELQPDFVLADEVHTYKNEDAGIGQTWKALHREWLARKIPINYFSATPATTLDELQYLYGLREWSLDGFGDWVARKTGHGTEEQQKKRKGGPEAAEDISQQVGGEATESIAARSGRIAQMGKALDAAVKSGDKDAEQTIRSQIARAEKDQKNKKWGQQKGDVFHVNVSTAEMEQIMRELKMKGKYIARDLWRGGVEFSEKEMPLSKAESEEWARAIDYMREVEKAFNMYANENDAMRKGFGITAFLQAAAKRKLFDFRLERAIAEGHESLKRGEQPVISTININETKEGEGYLAAALRSINVQKILMDKETGEVTDLGEIPEAVAVKAELTEKANKFFPPSPDPIAAIQKAFGKDNVAVVTGAESPKVRRQMMEDFQKGIKKVAVISGAGKTGISLHHVIETEGKAKGRRHLYEADYEWSATVFKQELGRVDRAGQISPPRITALTLGSAAEKKFISTIANRMKTLGAVSKGAAESAGANALEHFELGGDVDNMVVREMWKTLDKPLKEWFRGRKFIEYGEGGVTYPKHSIEGVGVRDFLLQLQLMPIDVGNKIWDHFWKEREETYGSQAVAEAEGRKTQKFSGQILRSVELKPDLTMYEVKDAAGHRSAILSGLVTDYMPVIQGHLESHREKVAALGGLEVSRKQREYISFTGDNGEQIAGLRIRPSAMEPISKALGKPVIFQHTPETAWKDLEAGDRIPLDKEGWELRMGSGGERKGKIIIDGAGMTNTERGKTIMPHGAKYSAVGNFFYLPDQATVDKFLERFPIKKQLTKEKAPADKPENLVTGESGSFTPAALNPARLQKRYANLAEKLISEKLKIGDKYWTVKQYDPKVADTLHLVDNAPRYLREKAAANLKTVTAGLSEDQTRLAALMVDSDSRDDLEAHHPQEFQQAENDSAVMDAVDKFKPLQDELTADRQALGWPVRMSLHVEENIDPNTGGHIDPRTDNPFVVLDREGLPVADFKTQKQADNFVDKNATVEPHLKRTYPEHSKSPLPADTGAGPSTGSFYADKGLRPPKMDRKSREMSADYHYQHGRKDFSGYLESYAQAKEAMLKQKLFDEFSKTATAWKQGTAQPPTIKYNGETYTRPDLVLKAKQGGEILKPYAVYDPSRGERFLIRQRPDEEGQGGWATLSTGKPGIGPMDRYLAPKPVVDALENYDTSRGGDGPGKFRKFLQEQIVGLFGPMVHVNNIIRHLGQGTGTGAFDPRSWASITRVMLSGELRDRMMQGVDDSTIDLLVRRGAYTDWRDITNLNAYIWGNFNPLNWIRAFGKGVLFDPKFLGGWGGLDPKARVILTDFLQEHAPGMSEQEVADAVNDAFGNYNRANWTERQRQIARFTLFPGWDTASAKWFIRHPWKVGVAGALVVLAANLVMHKLGLAKGDDWVDTSYLHWGDRKYRSGVISDSIGQHVVQPALSAAEAAIKGEDVAEGAEQGLLRGSSSLLGQLAGPSVEMVVDQLYNRKYAGGVSQIVEPEDKNIPGTWAPNRDLEKRIAFAALKGLPSLSRFINPKGQWDWAQGLGSAMGVSNYKYGAEERLKASVAKSMGYSQTLSVLAEREPEAAQKFVADPNKAVYLMFHNDLDQMDKDLKAIDKQKERVAMAGSLTQKERKESMASLDESRKQLLIAADALDDALTSAKLQMKSSSR